MLKAQGNPSLRGRKENDTSALENWGLLTKSNIHSLCDSAVPPLAGCLPTRTESTEVFRRGEGCSGPASVLCGLETLMRWKAGAMLGLPSFLSHLSGTTLSCVACCLLSENFCFMWFFSTQFLVVYGGWANPVPVTPS